MSYLVLARKWRPQSFEDIVGQEHVSKTLTNAISSERVAHAYLFTGARGVGKTSAARILAKALNCVDGPTTTPCNNCLPCKEISAGTAIDVHEIDGASNTSVDDIRDLKESINYLPSSYRKKIYIIDEVHMLSNNAFNALLKTLEEPPSHVIFIFATTEPHKIPDTILSRCQRFDFKRISVKLIFGRLKEIVAEEEIEIEDKGLLVIAREADGGMRDAQSLLDQVISFSGKKIVYDDIVDVLGVIDTALVQEAVSAVIEKDCKRCLEIVDRLFTYGWDVKEFGKMLLEYFRNLAVVKVAPNETNLIESTLDEIERMKETSAPVSLEGLYLYFDVMARGMEDINRSFHPKVTLEMLLLKMATLSSLTCIDDMIASLKGQLPGNQLSGNQSSGKAQTPPPVAVKPEKEEAPPLAESPAEEYKIDRPIDDVASKDKSGNSKKDWKGFVIYLKNKKGTEVLGPMLEHARLTTFEDDSIVINPDNDFSFGRIEDEKETLEKYCCEYFGREIRFEVQRSDKGTDNVNSIHEIRKKKESDLSRKLKKEASRHPMVIESLNVLGGEISEIKTERQINE